MVIAVKTIREAATGIAIAIFSIVLTAGVLVKVRVEDKMVLVTVFRSFGGERGGTIGVVMVGGVTGGTTGGDGGGGEGGIMGGVIGGIIGGTTEGTMGGVMGGITGGVTGGLMCPPPPWEQLLVLKVTSLP